LVGLLLFAWAVFIEIFWIPANRKKARHVSAGSQTEPVNEVLTKREDVTGDGVPDEIRLNLVGAGWDQPFKWTLSIISNNILVYEQSVDDAWLDRFFNDKGYVNEECPDYLSCKKQYYLEDLFKYRFGRVESKNEPLNSEYVDDIRRVAKDSLLVKYRLTPAEAERTIKWMVDHIKSGRAVIFNVPISPVQGGCSQMYVPRVGRFVTIYCP